MPAPFNPHRALKYPFILEYLKRLARVRPPEGAAPVLKPGRRFIFPDGLALVCPVFKNCFPPVAPALIRPAPAWPRFMLGRFRDSLGLDFYRYAGRPRPLIQEV